MTLEQERIADEIIQEHKNNDGIMHWGQYQLKMKAQKIDIDDVTLRIVLGVLYEKNLIAELFGKNDTRLTDPKWSKYGSHWRKYAAMHLQRTCAIVATTNQSISMQAHIARPAYFAPLCD